MLVHGSTFTLRCDGWEPLVAKLGEDPAARCGSGMGPAADPSVLVNLAVRRGWLVENASGAPEDIRALCPRHQEGDCHELGRTPAERRHAGAPAAAAH